MLTLLLVVGAALCALQALRVQRLLPAAIWLAGASAVTSLLLYQLGAPQAAVIELSVGAGLVFILFVFAINLSPGEPSTDRPLVPVPVALTLVGCVLLLLGELAWPRIASSAVVTSAALSTVLWHDRQLDVLVQVVLIFVGVLTVAGLLAPERQPSEAAAGSERATTERARPVPPSPVKPLPERPVAMPVAFTPVPRESLAQQKEKIA